MPINFVLDPSSEKAFTNGLRHKISAPIKNQIMPGVYSNKAVEQARISQAKVLRFGFGVLINQAYNHSSATTPNSITSLVTWCAVIKNRGIVMKIKALKAPINLLYQLADSL